MHCFRAAGASGAPYVQMGIHNIFLLVNLEEPTCAQGLAGPTPEGKEKSTRFLFWVMVVLLSDWVCLLLFACWSRLNHRGGVSGIHAAAGPAPTIYTHKIQKIQRRAHTKVRIQERRRAHKKKLGRRAHTKIPRQQKKHQKPVETIQTYNKIQLYTENRFQKKRAKPTYARKYNPRRDVPAKYGPVCKYNKVGILRDWTFFGRATWWRVLDLDPFS